MRRATTSLLAVITALAGLTVLGPPSSAAALTHRADHHLAASGSARSESTAARSDSTKGADRATPAQARAARRADPVTTYAVTGRVLNGDGNPLDAFVSARTDDDTQVDSEETGPDGTFTLDLPSDSYTLYVGANDSVYVDKAIHVDVAGAAVSIGDVVLARRVLTTVTGSVLGGDGAAAADVAVSLYQVFTDASGTITDYDVVSGTSTASDGSYSFSMVDASGTYTVGAIADRYRRTFLGNTASIDAATTFGPTTATTLAPITLIRVSTVGGIVRGTDGPVSDVDVMLYLYDPDTADFQEVDDVYTDEDGSFLLALPEPGSYSLYFDAQDTEAPVASAWLEGTTAPTSTTSPGVFAVGATTVGLTRDKTLPRAQAATGTVRNAAGAALRDARVTAYVYDGTGWDVYGHPTTSASNGSYALKVPASSTVTVGVERGGYLDAFLGGGGSLPETPSTSTSLQTGPTADAAVPDITLALYPTRQGRVAGQRLDYCLASALAPNDDGSSPAVDLPFPLTFFGDSYSQVFVNNNGNVTFGSMKSTYTPSDLTGPTERPIIAPFFADVDTRGNAANAATGTGSNAVTYGFSPDGRTMCVNWSDVGYFASSTDKLNTFQLLLTSTGTEAGRSRGDFDITFNYDEVLWETGNASNGVGGLGGTSAAAGFSAGSGAPGTFVQLPGSLVNGALLDSGSQSLTAGRQGSAQRGRYIYEVHNDGQTPTVGSLTGSVVRASDDSPVPGAFVEICPTAGATDCAYTETTSAGTYDVTALRSGSYTVVVRPDGSDLLRGGGTAVVTAGGTNTAAPIRLAAPTPIPSNATLSNVGFLDSGVPVVNYAAPLVLVVTGCAGAGAPTYTVTLTTGQVIRSAVPLTESPGGRYTATIAPLNPYTGDATITTNVPATCGGTPTTFTIYIDPSGVVTDQYGRPISGATVTLLRSDTATGPFTAVPSGSDIMSPANRSNPSTTDTAGYFRWDVTSGYYQVRTEATGCTPATSSVLEVPPARVDLLLELVCTAAAPVATTAPVVSGDPVVGKTLTAVAAAWPVPLVSTGVVLQRNGVTLGSSSYTLTAGDVGATFTAVATGRRPDYVSENGAGGVVSFTPVTSTSAGVIGTAAPVVTPPVVTPPVVTPPATGPSAACTSARGTAQAAQAAVVAADAKLAAATSKVSALTKKAKKATSPSSKAAAKKKLKAAKKAKAGAAAAAAAARTTLGAATAAVGSSC